MRLCTCEILGVGLAVMIGQEAPRLYWPGGSVVPSARQWPKTSRVGPTISRYAFPPPVNRVRTGLLM